MCRVVQKKKPKAFSECFWKFSEDNRCTFPGGADNKKWVDWYQEPPRNSLATFLTATNYSIFTASTKVLACGRHHKRGGAAFGRATSYVASFVEAVNIVNIVAIKTVAREFAWDSLGRADSKFS